MKNISILLIISMIFFVGLSGCDDDRKKSVDLENMSCSDCYIEIPDLVNVDLVFSFTRYGTPVIYTVYKGNAFNSSIYMEGETQLRYEWIKLPPNQKYTIVAEYIVNDKLYKVINDCYPRTEYLKNACDEACHYVHSTKCNLELKY